MRQFTSQNEILIIYTMGCPPIRWDDPWALASGLFYVQVDTQGIIIYTTSISVHLACLRYLVLKLVMVV